MRCYTGSGLKLHTNAFNPDEFKLLVKSLDKNFSIKLTIQNFTIENHKTFYISKKNNYLLL